MKILSLLIFLIANAYGGIKTDGEYILPMQRKSYPLKELIKDYADALKVNISYPEETLKNDKSTVDLFIHEKTSFAQFSSLFKAILDSKAYSLIQEKGYCWIANSKDMRYLPSEFYADHSFPNDDSYVTALFRLKYPVAAEITRSLRPFLSRYGRVINFADGRSLVIQEKGTTALKLYDAIKFMDTEKIYLITLNKPLKASAPEDNEFEQKLVDLEIKNKIL